MKKYFRFLIFTLVIPYHQLVNAQITNSWEWTGDENVMQSNMVFLEDTIFIASFFDFDGCTFFPMVYKLNVNGPLQWSSALYDYPVYDYNRPGIYTGPNGVSYVVLNLWDGEIGGNSTLILKMSNTGDLLRSQKYTGDEGSDFIELIGIKDNKFLFSTAQDDSAKILLYDTGVDTFEVVNSVYTSEFHTSTLTLDDAGNYYFSANDLLWKFKSDHSELWNKNLDHQVLSVNNLSEAGMVLYSGQYSTETHSWEYYITSLAPEGEINWIDTFKNEENSISLMKVSVDKEGNIIAGGVDRTNMVNTKIITRKYKNNGQISWTAEYETFLKSPYVNEVLTDSYGNVFISANISENDKFYLGLLVYDMYGSLMLDTLELYDEYLEVSRVQMLGNNEILVFGRKSGKLFLKSYTVTLNTHEMDVTHISCPGGADGSVTLYPLFGTAPYTYLWEEPLISNESSVNGLSAGTCYRFSITDALGQTVNDSIILNEPDPIIIDIDTSSITCHNYQDAEASFHVSGGTPPYSCFFCGKSVSEDSPMENLVSDVSYRIEVTDLNQCAATDSFMLFNPPAIELDAILGNPNVDPYEVASYSVSGPEDLVYTWSLEGGNMVNGQGTNIIEVQWGEPGTGMVTVSASNENNCPGDTSELQVTILSTVVSPHKNHKVQIYPNPFQNTLQIQLPAEASELKIVDICGRTMLSRNAMLEGSVNLNTSQFTPGIYLLRITSESGTGTMMIMKQ